MTLKKTVTSRTWGDYYMGDRKSRPWVLEVFHSLNQMTPTFGEVFDEETFYMFMLVVFISMVIIAWFLSNVVGVRLREHDIRVDRQWRDWRPANPFRYPWQVAKEFAERGAAASHEKLS